MRVRPTRKQTPATRAEREAAKAQGVADAMRLLSGEAPTLTPAGLGWAVKASSPGTREQLPGPAETAPARLLAAALAQEGLTREHLTAAAENLDTTGTAGSAKDELKRLCRHPEASAATLLGLLEPRRIPGEDLEGGTLTPAQRGALRLLGRVDLEARTMTPGASVAELDLFLETAAGEGEDVLEIYEVLVRDVILPQTSFHSRAEYDDLPETRRQWETALETSRRLAEKGSGEE